MANFLALLQTDAALLQCQLARLAVDSPLAAIPDAPVGVGYFQSNDVLLRKRPFAGPSPFSLARDVSSECLVVATGAASAGAYSEESTSPFRFRHWLWAYAGAHEAVADVQPTLLASLPDHLQRQLAGSSAAEALFLSFLEALRGGGQPTDDLELDLPGAAKALGSTLEKVSSPLAVCATNGRALLAAGRGVPLSYTLLEGLLPCPVHGLDERAADLRDNVRAHRMAKAVALTSRAAEGSWIAVPDGRVVTISRMLQVAVL